jgi:hypothetical protein
MARRACGLRPPPRVAVLPLFFHRERVFMSATPSKRQKERDRQDKAREKRDRRDQRKNDKPTGDRPTNGEDPDIAGIVPGPQPPIEY